MYLLFALSFWKNCFMQIENLAAVVHAIAKSCGANTVVDVGSGQVMSSACKHLQIPCFKWTQLSFQYLDCWHFYSLLFPISDLKEPIPHYFLNLS
jgi:hypothetical protein